AWRSDFTHVMKDGGRSATAGRGVSLAQRVGGAAQVAFALPLLIGASPLLRRAINVGRVDLGFAPAHLITPSFPTPRRRHPSDRAVADYYARLVDGVRAVPGVTSAGLVNRIPLAGMQTNPVSFPPTAAAKDTLTNVDSRTVTPDYFATLGIRLLEGRTFT